MMNDGPVDAGTASTSEESVSVDEPQRQQSRMERTADDFLVPGPTPTSNAGLRRWGITWIVFSVLLMLLMLGISFSCWVLARAIGAA